MTPTRIRYILSGLKEEIRRETSFQRRCHLADMGLYWNLQLLSDSKLDYYDYEKGCIVDVRTCIQCRQQKDISNFGIVKANGHTYRRQRCNRCLFDTDKVKFVKSLAKHRAISDI